MNVRVLAAGLCTWWMCTSGVASAQGVPGGGELELPTLGASFRVPEGAGSWIARKDAGGDVLQRTRPVNPYLSVLLNVPDGETSCAEQLGSLAGKGLGKVDRPALVPAGFDSAVLSASNAGETLVALCSQDHGKVLVALVTYAAGIDGADLTSVVPVLEAAGKSVLAAPRPAPATTAVEASDDLEPQRLVLPSTGLVLVLSSPATWVATKGKNGRDLLTRSEPADPALSVGIEVLRTRRKVGCGSILEQHRASTGKGDAVEGPAYLADGWHPTVSVRYSGGKGRVLACAELPAGYLLATITYSGSLDDKDALAVRPVLAASLQAGEASVVAEKPRSSSLFGGDSFRSPEFFLAGQHIAPAEPELAADPERASGTGSMLGVRQAGMLRFSRSSAFGLSGRYVLSAGWDLEHGLVLDGLVGIGVGITVDRVSLMPMVGAGGDSIGTGETEADTGEEASNDLHMAFEIFNYYGGVALVQFTRAVALEASFGYCDRGPIRELRGDARLLVLPSSFRKVSAGVVYTDIETVATTWQLVLGIGF